MNSIRVKVGRNVGTTPLSDTEWGQFQLDVVSIVLDSITDTEGIFDEQIETVGEWDGDTEDSFEYYVTDIKSDINYTRLVSNLKALKTVYKQEAISLTLGQGELI